jgi:hypothetical protein
LAPSERRRNHKDRRQDGKPFEAKIAREATLAAPQNAKRLTSSITRQRFTYSVEIDRKALDAYDA